MNPQTKMPLEPAIIVIFGITGDLSRRYLLPALYHLISDNLLHAGTKIIGVSRRDVSVDSLLDATKLCVLETDKTCDPTALEHMCTALSMFKMSLNDSADYDKLLAHLNSIEDVTGMCMNRLYYLSIPPSVYGPIVKHLGERGLNASCQHGRAATRLLVEKPFGYDVASAEQLITETGKHFGEEQIFRIDHYLAKETVQNILTFRLHNPIFEALWNNRHVAAIEVEANEKIDIAGRAAFYEQTGALRDLVQSHLMQVMAVTTMEPSRDMTSEAIHASKLELLKSVEPVPADKVAERTVRGQYEGYPGEVGNPHSTIETYAAVQLFINNTRWQGVPVTLRTGKALHERKTIVRLTFKHVAGKTHYPNVLTFSIRPHEGIGINLFVKRPGFDEELQSVPMEFSYARSFNDHGHPDAYERVLVDAVRGDHTLFATSDEVLTSWRILQNVITAWTTSASDLHIYKKGSATVK